MPHRSLPQCISTVYEYFTSDCFWVILEPQRKKFHTYLLNDLMLDAYQLHNPDSLDHECHHHDFLCIKNKYNLYGIEAKLAVLRSYEVDNFVLIDIKYEGAYPPPAYPYFNLIRRYKI